MADFLSWTRRRPAPEHPVRRCRQPHRTIGVSRNERHAPRTAEIRPRGTRLGRCSSMIERRIAMRRRRKPARPPVLLAHSARADMLRRLSELSAPAGSRPRVLGVGKGLKRPIYFEMRIVREAKYWGRHGACPSTVRLRSPQTPLRTGGLWLGGHRPDWGRYIISNNNYTQVRVGVVACVGGCRSSGSSRRSGGWRSSGGRQTSSCRSPYGWRGEDRAGEG